MSVRRGAGRYSEDIDHITEVKEFACYQATHSKQPTLPSTWWYCIQMKSIEVEWSRMRLEEIGWGGAMIGRRVNSTRFSVDVVREMWFWAQQVTFNQASPRRNTYKNWEMSWIQLPSTISHIGAMHAILKPFLFAVFEFDIIVKTAARQHQLQQRHTIASCVDI